MHGQEVDSHDEGTLQTFVCICPILPVSVCLYFVTGSLILYVYALKKMFLFFVHSADSAFCRKSESIVVDGDEVLLVEVADCFLEGLFRYLEFGIDVFCMTFVVERT